MENQNYFEQLEKIANDALRLVDMAGEPMHDDPQPQIHPGDVEATQANLPDMIDPEGSEEQQPQTPEDAAAFQEALDMAHDQLESAKMTLASAVESQDEFEKTASQFYDSLPSAAALAKLIEYSTSESIDEELRKLASDRFIQALESEENFVEVLDKTAKELFEDQENTELLYSPEGINYVVEHLALFAEDEELDKVAFDLTGAVNQAKKWTAETIDSARKLQTINEQVNAAQAEVNQLTQMVTQNQNALLDARKLEPEQPDLVSNLTQKLQDTNTNWSKATTDLHDAQNLQLRGKGALATGVGGAVGGALFGGKKIADATNKPDEEELSEKSASVTMVKEESVFGKGGNINMGGSIVKDFLKIAGASVLLDIANDEGAEESLRKEAAESFNAISRMGRKDMEENLVKVATQLYTEDQLHQIVSGKHNEELFSKIAFFTDVHELSADELEKVAGAESVAAKGVGGALTDAKSNIESKIEGDKKETETVKNGEIGSKKADDMRGYNVINSPGEYKVEKSASLKEMVGEAELRKEAAFRDYVALDTFIKNNIR